MADNAKYAQRVGKIINPTKEGKRLTFEVVPPGQDKGLKCGTWLETGEGEYDEDTKTYERYVPNLLASRILDLRASEMEGPWRVGGKERKVVGKEHTYRAFNATSLDPADSTDDQIYTMDPDGDPIQSVVALDGAQNGQGATKGTTPAPSAPDDGATFVRALSVVCLAKAMQVEITEQMIHQAEELALKSVEIARWQKAHSE